MKRLARLIALIASVALAGAAFGQANVRPQARNLDTGTLQTLTAQSAATVNSADVNNYNAINVVCVFTQSTYTGSPSTTFSIQNYDPASAQYYSVITSSAVTTALTPNWIAAGTDVSNSSNVSQSVPISKTWRTSVTVGGSSTPTVTGTVRCSVN